MLRRKYRKIYNFSVPIKNDKTITYQLKFTDSFKFMSSSLSSLVDNLSEGTYNNKSIDCKSGLE